MNYLMISEKIFVENFFIIDFRINQPTNIQGVSFARNKMNIIISLTKQTPDTLKIWFNNNFVKVNTFWYEF